MATKTTRGARRRSSPADQMHLPLDETDIRHNNKLLGVYRDHNAHHAIVVKIGKTRISFVEMRKGQLAVCTLATPNFSVCAASSALNIRLNAQLIIS